MPPLTLGYKASAEQFSPRVLVELGVLAEEHGFVDHLRAHVGVPVGDRSRHRIGCIGHRRSRVRVAIDAETLPPVKRAGPQQPRRVGNTTQTA
jgi:hypothetical protein